MFRSLFNKLRAKFSGAKASEIEKQSESENEVAPTIAAKPDSGLGNDTRVAPSDVSAARKGVGSAPMPIPSIINDPIAVEDDDEFNDQDAAIAAERAEATELADGAFNPIAAASSPEVADELDVAPEVEPEQAAEAEAVFELDTEPIPHQPVVSAEALCDIDPESMDREEIRSRLAVLYRRYNAVASSLNAEMRAEAEQMLNAIVVCRETYVDHV